MGSPVRPSGPASAPRAKHPARKRQKPPASTGPAPCCTRIMPLASAKGAPPGPICHYAPVASTRSRYTLSEAQPESSTCYFQVRISHIAHVSPCLTDHCHPAQRYVLCPACALPTPPRGLGKATGESGRDALVFLTDALKAPQPSSAGRQPPPLAQHAPHGPPANIPQCAALARQPSCLLSHRQWRAPREPGRCSQRLEIAPAH